MKMKMKMKVKHSQWMQGLLHAERIVQRYGLAELKHLISTHEYVDANPDFLIGVTDYVRHYNARLTG